MTIKHIITQVWKNPQRLNPLQVYKHFGLNNNDHKAYHNTSLKKTLNASIHSKFTNILDKHYQNILI